VNLIFAYYDNGKMLERQVEEWQKYSNLVKSMLSVYIVDDGSENDPALPHLKPVGFPIHLYRVKQNLVWNQTGARNLAMHNASDDWCLMMDMDCLLTAQEADKVVAMHKVSRRFYMPRAANYHGILEHQHPNVMLLERSIFWESGGYDEDFQGWYGSDSPFKRALGLVARRVDTDKFTIRRVRRSDIADASTVEWGRKGSEYHSMQNPILRAKRKMTYKAENHLRFDWEKVCVI
jgi:glycosyltransferase involved in cell wall biosynthesis